ncbi:hypothetical protein [Streptomyces sp. RKND-216]|uniref:hypothetical protein n=1 Tax=Streptomyces sp. RKND-216 TaxID=2562581 RepID=UPI001FF84000|nr:hypothetical protein [Streptomyces sp. RKND-216]
MTSVTRADSSTVLSCAYMDIVVVRREPCAPGGETTVVRLLGLLPPHWSCLPEVERDRVVLHVMLGSTDGCDAVRTEVEEVMADPAMRGWFAET